MRLFIAIMLSDDMKKSVIGTMHELKKADVHGSYVPAQNLHVTLAFIGETRDAAPVKAAILPLVRKDGMPEIAKEIYGELKKKMAVQYDEKGAVGRRYRRQDEIGTPFCVTVDGQTTQDQTVTLRDRDTLEQTRVKIDELAKVLEERIE